MSTVRTERGWPAHFICGDRCLFRRNTLLENDDSRVIVSTVGCMRNPRTGQVETIGALGRYYETMAFAANKEGPYWEINVERQVSFDSDWSISADSPEALPDDVDNRADSMHETVVSELSAKLGYAPLRTIATTNHGEQHAE